MARGITLVWSCITADNLGDFPYLYLLEALTVCVDNDPAGRTALENLGRRWQAEATAVGVTPEIRKIMAPHPSEDFNDWAASFGDV